METKVKRLDPSSDHKLFFFLRNYLSAHQEVIFGTMYSLASVSLGVFVLVYYVISRSDVQHCFAALTTFVKNRVISSLSKVNKETPHNELQTEVPVTSNTAQAFSQYPSTQLQLSSTAGLATKNREGTFLFHTFLQLCLPKKGFMSFSFTDLEY